MSKQAGVQLANLASRDLCPEWFASHIAAGGSIGSALTEWGNLLVARRRSLEGWTEADADEHLQYVLSTGVPVDMDRYWRQRAEAQAWRAAQLAEIAQDEARLAAVTAEYIPLSQERETMT